MLWIPDKTGDFLERPKYSNEELEATCERHMSPLMFSRHGDGDRPTTEDDLTVLLETSLGVELDLTASFFSEEGWVQGITDFRPPAPPLVRIRRSLSEDRRYLNRYKTTLGHEAGHVLCLREACEREGNVLRRESRCLRYSGERIDIRNWKEYQADYCAGALQMRRRILAIRLGLPPERDSRPWIGSNLGRSLIARVAEEFGVSEDAARVRLISTGYLRRPIAARQFPLPMPLEDFGPITDARPEPGSLSSLNPKKGRGLIVLIPEESPVPRDAARQLLLPF